MNIRDWAWLTFLAIFGAFIWLRDRAWVASPSETLPILVALPLFVWFGSPWDLQKTRFRLASSSLTASGLLLLAGLAVDSTFLLAAAWTLALWSWMRGRFGHPPLVSRRLLLLPMMAFPWVSLDLEPLGWWFRLTAAWSTQHLFAATGLDVTRHGTHLLVQGQPIDVTPACSGMHSLQAYLIAGILIAFTEQKTPTDRDEIVASTPPSASFFLTNAFWFSVATIPVLAWIANVIRVSTLTAAALTWGDDFARGWFHSIGGWVAIAIPFICWWGILRAVKSCQTRPHDAALEPVPFKAGPPPARSSKILASINPQWGILALCIWQASDLMIAWSHSPFDSFGWLALLLWITPPAHRVIRKLRAGSIFYRNRSGEDPTSHPPMPRVFWAALLASFFGTLTDLHFLRHCALALACAGLTSRFKFWLPWFILSISWMPALGWFLASLHPGAVALVRISMAVLAAMLPVYGARNSSTPPEATPLKGSPENRLWAGFAAVFLFSLAHQLPPAPQGSQPAGVISPPDLVFCKIPRSGLGFQSRDIPLTPIETTVYREAATLKRSYQASSQRFILTAVNGSRNRHAVHDPLYCIRGDGWQILRAQSITVPGGSARLLDIVREGRRTQVLFWFSNASTRHQSASRAWWLGLARRISFGLVGSDPTLVFLQPATDLVPDWNILLARCPFLFEI